MLNFKIVKPLLDRNGQDPNTGCYWVPAMDVWDGAVIGGDVVEAALYGSHSDRLHLYDWNYMLAWLHPTTEPCTPTPLDECPTCHRPF